MTPRLRLDDDERSSPLLPDTQEKTTRYFPAKLPIGVPRDGGRRHVFLYLITREVPAEFRLFLLLHADLLRAVNEWTIRVLAAFAQFDNDVRSDRTRVGMRAALELGRWTFLAPLGYMTAPRGMGKSLIPDPERAPLVHRAFQDFATGRFTKEEIRKTLTALGLKTRRGLPLPPQTFDGMLRNRVYIGQINVPDYSVSTRGDFEPLVSEKICYRVQAILDGRLEMTAPRQRNDPDFPLRGYVRCEACDKPLTASWAKGRSEYYAYYHCRGRCRAVNISKTKLEDLFVDELARTAADVGVHAPCEGSRPSRMA